MKRRSVLKAGLLLIATATSAAVFGTAQAAARVLAGGTKWKGRITPPPTPVDPTQRMFFTDHEAVQLKAIFDRLIPADELTPSASELGCVVFVDHQLAGDYGKAQWKYLAGPVRPGTMQQGQQATWTPADLYRKGLAEIDTYTRAHFGGPFESLRVDEQDRFLEQLEQGKVPLASVPAATLFAQFLGNAKEGFLADPVYGGNKGMAAWKMIGFPGARYDYRDYVAKKGKPMNIAPVSIAGRL